MCRKLSAVLILYAALMALGISCDIGDRELHGGEAIEEVELQEILDRRLNRMDFSLVEDDPEASELSREILDNEIDIPNQWPKQFAGDRVAVQSPEQMRTLGILHDDGRSTCVYLLPEPRLPAYGELVPLAIAHYHIPDPNLDIVLLLVCFQSDPQEKLSGIGVRSIDPEGREVSTPFAVALKPEYLAGRELYDEFLSGEEVQAVGAHTGWSRGFLLLSRVAPDVILSAYLHWN